MDLQFLSYNKESKPKLPNQIARHYISSVKPKKIKKLQDTNNEMQIYHYHFFQKIAITFTTNSDLSPIWAIMLPNIIFGKFAYYLFQKAEG